LSPSTRLIAKDGRSSATATARIGVVLVNWNTPDLTCACIAALEKSELKPDCIVVVDNASLDQSADTIAEKYPAVQVIKNKENLGFAGGNNVGVRALLKAGCEYVWILNNDTVPAPDCLKHLLGELLDDISVGATTAKILRESPPECLWYAGAEVSRWSMTARHRGEGEIDDGRYDQCQDVEFMSGCCMLVRGAVLRRIGLFDELFFAYSEDFDWCLRATATGIRLRYVPTALITHRVSASMDRISRKNGHGSTSPFVVYVSARNRFFVIRKHARGLKKLVALSTWLVRLACHGAALVLLGRWEKVGALLRGVREGLRRNITESSQTDVQAGMLVPNVARGLPPGKAETGSAK
jgi:GT2 family glycosyltransferase